MSLTTHTPYALLRVAGGNHRAAQNDEKEPALPGSRAYFAQVQEETARDITRQPMQRWVRKAKEPQA